MGNSLHNRKWLFLDVGNVILNDDPGVAYSYKLIHEELVKRGINITFNDLLNKRDEFFINSNKRLPRDLVLNYCSYDEEKLIRNTIFSHIHSMWYDLNPIIPKAKSFIKRAYSKYNLGIIANQPVECYDVLKKHDLVKYFKVIALSDSLGISKPDIGLFNWALKEANTDPGRSIMVGDRLDNDIAPSKSIGMTAIHLKLDLDKKMNGYVISYEHEVYLSHIRRFNISYRESNSDDEIPHFTANSYDELGAYLIN